MNLEGKSAASIYGSVDTAVSATKKIMLVGCHPILGRGLTSVINSQVNFIAFDEVIAYENTLKASELNGPDLVIVDVKVKDKQGFQLVKQLREKHPDIPTLVFCSNCDLINEQRAIKAGASGYVSNAIDEINLLNAINSVLAGHTYMSSALRTYLSRKIKNGKSLTGEHPQLILSDRELQVFSLIGQGIGTRDLATKLNVSIKTIESHKEHIKNKLALNSYSELAKSASLWFEELG